MSFQDPIFACMPYEQMRLAAEPVKKYFDELLDRVQEKLIALGVKAVRKTGPIGNQATW